MRRLILMRHAKSSWADPGQRDLDRPLNKRGRHAAGALGAWLKRRGYAPGHALVSTARRAQETWAGVVAATGAAIHSSNDEKLPFPSAMPVKKFLLLQASP
jgi:phosphohistidine phosphatase